MAEGDSPKKDTRHRVQELLAQGNCRREIGTLPSSGRQVGENSRSRRGIRDSRPRGIIPLRRLSGFIRF
jgi:hypothetical protein